MRNRYGRALYGLAAAFAVTTTLGLTAAGAATASTKTVKPDVTPACTYGDYCSDPIFNVEFGIQYFETNASDVSTVGARLSLAYANDNNPGQDWRVTTQDTVSYLYHLGWISSAYMVHYPFNLAFEVMWTPYGVESNLCRGVSLNAFQGELVTLEPCGDFPRTLWIVGENYTAADHAMQAQHAAGGGGGGGGYGPYYGGNELINGSSVNPSVPFVLTAGGGIFGGNPFAPLQIFEQTAVDGVLNPGQAWCTAYVWYPLGNSVKKDKTAKAEKVQPATVSGYSPVTPPTIGPPTYTANKVCFPFIAIGFGSNDGTISGGSNGDGGSDGGSNGTNNGTGGSTGGTGGSTGGSDHHTSKTSKTSKTGKSSGKNDHHKS
jgi:hypothetical protein